MASTGQQQGGTTMTKVFVGGLAWETQEEALRAHFGKYGEILEAVIIFDRTSGRSKGYGFVTFREAAAANKACEDATPVINGRRANCNLAALGIRRLRASPTRPRAVAVATAQQGAARQLWYYPRGPPPPSGPLQHYYGGFPFVSVYGYPPFYPKDGGYSVQKPNPSAAGGLYTSPSPYPVQVTTNAQGLPVYAWYQWHQRPPSSMPAADAAATTTVMRAGGCSRAG